MWLKDALHDWALNFVVHNYFGRAGKSKNLCQGHTVVQEHIIYQLRFQIDLISCIVEDQRHTMLGVSLVMDIGR